MNARIAQAFALLPDYLAWHVLLSFCALALGLAVSLPLAVAASRSPRLRWPLLAFAGFIQTIPSLALLALSLGFMIWVARTRGFSTEDEIAIAFAGCNKSLAAGVPMAGVLFPAATVGFVLLPVMLYHQFQLMVCAALAQRYAKRPLQEQSHD